MTNDTLAFYVRVIGIGISALLMAPACCEVTLADWLKIPLIFAIPFVVGWGIRKWPLLRR